MESPPAKGCGSGSFPWYVRFAATVRIVRARPFIVKWSYDERVDLRVQGNRSYSGIFDHPYVLGRSPTREQSTFSCPR